MSDEPETIPFYRDRFTPAQRRRVEALILVGRLYPALDPDAAAWLARWIVTGRLDLEAAAETESVV